jgi:hypothetical protein
VRRVIILAAALSAVIGFAAPAHADDSDTLFVKAIKGHGITFAGSDADLANLGRMTCALLDDGYSTNSIVAMGQLHGNSMSTEDARFLVTTAEAAYCPQYIN